MNVSENHPGITDDKPLLRGSLPPSTSMETETSFSSSSSLCLFTGDSTTLSSARELMGAVGAKVSTHLKCSGCLFAEIDEAQENAIVEYASPPAGVLDGTGVHRLSEFVSEEFLERMRAGETVVVRNIP